MRPVPEDWEARRVRNLRTLSVYFRLLEDADIAGWASLWAPECRQLVPYATGELPREVLGREDVRALYQRISDGFTSLRFTLVELLPLADPDRIWGRWRPRCELVDGGIYTNESVGLFEFDAEGAIVHFTEYFDPAGFAERF